MQKSFGDENHVERLWAYVVILYRLYMVLCHVAVRQVAEPIVGPFLSLMGSLLYLLFHVIYTPQQTMLANHMMTGAMIGIIVLCVFQLCAEIQVRLNNFSDTDWIQEGWTYTLIGLSVYLSIPTMYSMVQVAFETAEKTLDVFDEFTSHDKPFGVNDISNIFPDIFDLAT